MDNIKKGDYVKLRDGELNYILLTYGKSYEVIEDSSTTEDIYLLGINIPAIMLINDRGNMYRYSIDKFVLDKDKANIRNIVIDGILE